MSEPLKLYWKAVWGTPKNVERQGGIVMDNDRMEKVINEAHAAGVKYGAPDSERKGIEIFGQALREKIQDWPAPTPDNGFVQVHTIPVWDLERLLDEWNIPTEPRLIANGSYS